MLLCCAHAINLPGLRDVSRGCPILETSVGSIQKTCQVDLPSGCFLHHPA